MKAVPAAAVSAVRRTIPTRSVSEGQQHSSLALRVGVGGCRCAREPPIILELTKPRMAVLVLFTVAVGGCLAGLADGHGLAAAVTRVVGNRPGGGRRQRPQSTAGTPQRRPDACAPKTGRCRGPIAAAGGAGFRPGPAASAAWLPGGGCAASAAVAIAAVTFVSYVWLYTPLKRLTTLNTLIGAVPGRLPPVIGWTAVRGTLDVRGGRAVSDRVPLAGAALPGHRLDLPRGLCAGRACGCCPSSIRGAHDRPANGGVLRRPGAGEPVPAFGSKRGGVYAVGAMLLGWAFSASTLAFFARHRPGRPGGCCGRRCFICRCCWRCCFWKV